jgi:hypothetical protein
MIYKADGRAKYDNPSEYEKQGGMRGEPWILRFYLPLQYVVHPLSLRMILPYRACLFHAFDVVLYVCIIDTFSIFSYHEIIMPLKRIYNAIPKQPQTFAYWPDLQLLADMQATSNEKKEQTILKAILQRRKPKAKPIKKTTLPTWIMENHKSQYL